MWGTEPIGACTTISVVREDAASRLGYGRVREILDLEEVTRLWIDQGDDHIDVCSGGYHSGTGVPDG